MSAWQIRRAGERAASGQAETVPDKDVQSQAEADRHTALKVELHQRLLDLINLSALETMSREQIHAEILYIDRSRSCRLHRVGVQEHAMLSGNRRNVLDRLNGAHFVVRQHDRNQRRFRTNGSFDLSRIDESLGIDRCD